MIARSVWTRVSGDDYLNCWQWTGYLNRDGYGLALIDGRTRVVHRAIYEHLIASIPADLVIDHLCRNRGCVNPWHMEPVTPRVNTLRSSIAPAAINATKTHCPQGHPYTEENTYRHNGERQCITCMRQHKRATRDRQRGGPPRPYGAAVTHCPAGHPYDEQNTARRPDGRRRCKTCDREYARRKREESAA